MNDSDWHQFFFSNNGFNKLYNKCDPESAFKVENLLMGSFLNGVKFIWYTCATLSQRPSFFMFYLYDDTSQYLPKAVLYLCRPPPPKFLEPLTYVLLVYQIVLSFLSLSLGMIESFCWLHYLQILIQAFKEETKHFFLNNSFFPITICKPNKSQIDRKLILKPCVTQSAQMLSLEQNPSYQTST